MRTEKIVKAISRIVVMIHPGQLTNGVVLPIARTDFDATDKELDDWRTIGTCLYDGPPIDGKVRRDVGFSYVDVITKGYEGCLNLFWGEYCVALVNHPDIVDQMRKVIPLQQEVPFCSNVKDAMKFRKKPVVIEAVQWTDSKASWDEIMKMGNIKWSPGDMGGKFFYIETLEGKMRVSNGDWVIRGVKGEFYPCKNDIFQGTYEKVVD